MTQEPQQQPAAADPMKEVNQKKMLTGILAIVLGWLGIHKFILGQTTAGIIMAAVSVVSCGTLSIVPWVIGVVEGIMYLTKTDEEFKATYMDGDGKAWF